MISKKESYKSVSSQSIFVCRLRRDPHFTANSRRFSFSKRFLELWPLTAKGQFVRGSSWLSARCHFGDPWILLLSAPTSSSLSQSNHSAGALSADSFAAMAARSLLPTRRGLRLDPPNKLYFPCYTPQVPLSWKFHLFPWILELPEFDTFNLDCCVYCIGLLTWFLSMSIIYLLSWIPNVRARSLCPRSSQFLRRAR